MRGAVSPARFPGALWIARGVGCTCPAPLPWLPAAGPAFPQGSGGGRGWTSGGSDPSLGSCAQRLRACSAGKKGFWQGGAFPRAHPEPQFGNGELPEAANPHLAGLKTAKPYTRLCPISRAAPWLILLIIINFFHVLLHILREERRGDARVFPQGPGCCF